MKELCSVAEIPRSSFYYIIAPKAKTEYDQILQLRLKENQDELDFTYGAKRMAKHLTIKYGEVYNHKRVANRMHRWGLQSKIRRKRFPDGYYRTKNEKIANTPGNILNREFTASQSNKKIVTDITYLRVKEGWLFLSAVLDLFNNEIITHTYSRRLDMDLVLTTIGSLPKDGSLKDCIFHSDKGWTYTNQRYCNALAELNITQSFSRKANPWDNAGIESFFGILKSETIYRNDRKKLLSAAELQLKIEQYIEFYNTKRIQKKLGYQSPIQYRQSVASQKICV